MVIEHPARTSSGRQPGIYQAVMARGRLQGDHWIWTGPVSDTPPAPYGLSEREIEQIYRDSVSGGMSLAAVDAMHAPKGPPGPLEPAMAEIERSLLAMKGRPNLDLQVENLVERGVVTSRVTGTCGRCSDSFRVAVAGQWRECQCAGPRAAALRIGQAGLPADALLAVNSTLRPHRFSATRDGQDVRMEAAEVERITSDWLGQVVRGEPMEHPVLWLGGVYRAGKSWAAMRLAMRLCQSRVSVRWRAMVDLLAQLRKGIDEGPSPDDILETLASPSVRVLVLDDLGAGGGGSEWYVQVYEALLGRRVEARRPMIITTNLSRTQVGALVGARLEARIRERWLPIGFGGPGRAAAGPQQVTPPQQHDVASQESA